MPIFGRRRFVVPAFAMLVLFWGSAFAAVKVGLDYSPPVLFAGMRSFVGGLTITAVALVWGGRPNLGRDWGVFVLLSLLNVVLFLGLQTFAVMLLPSGTAAVVIYLQPILIGVLAWFVLGEPLSAGKMLGLLLGFAGIVAVSSGGFSGEISAAGIAFAVASALAWALGTVYFKKVQERVSMLWAVALPVGRDPALDARARHRAAGRDLLVGALRRETLVLGAGRDGACLGSLARACSGGRGKPGGCLRVLRAAGLGGDRGSLSRRATRALPARWRRPRRLWHLPGELHRWRGEKER